MVAQLSMCVENPQKNINKAAFELLAFVLCIFPALCFASFVLVALPLSLVRGTIVGAHFELEDTFLHAAMEGSASHVHWPLAEERNLEGLHHTTVLLGSVLSVAIFCIAVSIEGGPMLSYMYALVELAADGMLERSVTVPFLHVCFLTATIPLCVLGAASLVGAVLVVGGGVPFKHVVYLVSAQLCAVDFDLEEDVTLQLTLPVKLALLLLAVWGISLRAVVVAMVGGPALSIGRLFTFRRRACGNLCWTMVFIAVCLPIAVLLSSVVLGALLSKAQPLQFHDAFLAILMNVTSAGSSRTPLFKMSLASPDLLFMASSVCRLCISACSVVVLGWALSEPLINKLMWLFRKKSVATARSRVAAAVFLGCLVVAFMHAASFGLLFASLEGCSSYEGMLAMLTKTFGTQTQLGDWELLDAASDSSMLLLACGGFLGVVVRTFAIGATVGHVILPMIWTVPGLSGMSYVLLVYDDAESPASPDERTPPEVPAEAPLPSPRQKESPQYKDTPRSRTSMTEFLQKLESEPGPPVFANLSFEMYGCSPREASIGSKSEDSATESHEAPVQWPEALPDKECSSLASEPGHTLSIRKVVMFAEGEFSTAATQADQLTATQRPVLKEVCRLRLEEPEVLTLEAAGGSDQCEQQQQPLPTPQAQQKEAAQPPTARSGISLDSELVRSWVAEHMAAAAVVASRWRQ